MIRVVLPAGLQLLAGCPREIEVEVHGAVSVASILDAVEDLYPMLKGTMREHDTGKRRPRVRFFANKTDVSLARLDTPLPAVIADGAEPLLVVGAISGG
ncbi:MAG: MoaD/ThiS family protein [Pseudomonadota bacterium]